MFCRNCGNKINNGAKYCEKCGNQVLYQNNNTVQANNKSNVPNLCVASYILLGIIAFSHISFIIAALITANSEISDFMMSSSFVGLLSAPVTYIIGLIITIVAKIKFPKNRHPNILIILYVIMGLILVAEIIFVISLINSCISAINNCNNLG